MECFTDLNHLSATKYISYNCNNYLEPKLRVITKFKHKTLTNLVYSRNVADVVLPWTPSDELSELFCEDPDSTRSCFVSTMFK